MTLRFAAMKLAALLSFCGGPLLAHDLTKPHEHPFLAFLLAFLPVGLMAWGAVSLELADFTNLERLYVALGVLGSVATLLLNLFAAWYLLGHPQTPDHKLYALGILIGFVSTSLYVFLARRWLSTYNSRDAQPADLVRHISPR
jgi:hypothetical protein